MYDLVQAVFILCLNVYIVNMYYVYIDHGFFFVFVNPTFFSLKLRSDGNSVKTQKIL